MSGLHAGDGKPATLVLTDVESSTELWEWDRVTMMEAISVHDRCMRTHLTDYSGYEVRWNFCETSRCHQSCASLRCLPVLFQC